MEVMNSPSTMVEQLQRLPLPVDAWVVLPQPAHPQDRIAALQRHHHHRQLVLVAACLKLHIACHVPRLRAHACRQIHVNHLVRQSLSDLPTLLHQPLANETTARSRVHQHQCALVLDESFDLEKRGRLARVERAEMLNGEGVAELIEVDRRS